MAPANNPARQAASRPEAAKLENLAPDLDPATGIDLSLVWENLKLTPRERILANDDTVNFYESARAALLEQSATTRPTGWLLRTRRRGRLGAVLGENRKS